MKPYTCLAVAISLLTLVVTSAAQISPATSASASAQIPRLIRFSGIVRDEAGQPVTGVLGVTFALYSEEEGGAPLWLEMQNVQADANGHYTVLIGAESHDGVPLDLFSSAEVHWIGTQIHGHGESTRVMLLSVPYALKAADAETLGGFPASAFIHANPAEATGAQARTLAPAPASRLRVLRGIRLLRR